MLLVRAGRSYSIERRSLLDINTCQRIRSRYARSNIMYFITIDPEVYTIATALTNGCGLVLAAIHNPRNLIMTDVDAVLVTEFNANGANWVGSSTDSITSKPVIIITFIKEYSWF